LGFGAGCGGCVVLACGAETGVTLGYWKVWDAACMSIENYASAAAELRPPALSDVVRRVEQDPLRQLLMAFS
jgi:hypothetical protein